MKTKKYWLAASSVVCCAAFLSVIVSGISPSEKRQLENFGISTLRGLRAVMPQIMLVKDKEDKPGLLTKEQLQTQVELALRKAGIKIVSSLRGLDDGLFIVLVKVAKAGGKTPFYAMHVQCGLYQAVELSRDPTIRTEAQTWPSFGKSRFGIVSSAAVKRAVKDTVAGQVSEFISDYLAANPKAEKKHRQQEKMITGTVRYLELEGGFYGLVADNGERYDPVNLPREYAKDGLRVKFQVKEKKGAVGFHMWGKIVEIIRIERL